LKTRLQMIVWWLCRYHGTCAIHGLIPACCRGVHCLHFHIANEENHFVGWKFQQEKVMDTIPSTNTSFESLLITDLLILPHIKVERL
jgi:hypothetical protein